MIHYYLTLARHYKLPLVYFLPYFSFLYDQEWLILLTIYVLNKEILQNNWPIVIKSSFKSKMGYNGVHTVNKTLFIRSNCIEVITILPPVDLYLISEKSIWKNQLQQTGFLVCLNWIFTSCVSRNINYEIDFCRRKINNNINSFYSQALFVIKSWL